MFIWKWWKLRPLQWLCVHNGKQAPQGNGTGSYIESKWRHRHFLLGICNRKKISLPLFRQNHPTLHSGGLRLDYSNPTIVRPCHFHFVGLAGDNAAISGVR